MRLPPALLLLLLLVAALGTAPAAAVSDADSELMAEKVRQALGVVGVPTTVPVRKTPTTKSPTLKPTTRKPTTKSPTLKPTTRKPTFKPTTRTPTQRPSTAQPTKQPTTLPPTLFPTERPTLQPTYLPSNAPTPSPVVMVWVTTATYVGSDLVSRAQTSELCTAARLPQCSAAYGAVALLSFEDSPMNTIPNTNPGFLHTSPVKSPTGVLLARTFASMFALTGVLRSAIGAGLVPAQANLWTFSSCNGMWDKAYWPTKSATSDTSLPQHLLCNGPYVSRAEALPIMCACVL